MANALQMLSKCLQMSGIRGYISGGRNAPRFCWQPVVIDSFVFCSVLLNRGRLGELRLLGLVSVKWTGMCGCGLSVCMCVCVAVRRSTNVATIFGSICI